MQRYTHAELSAFIQIWQTSDCMDQVIERVLTCKIHRNPAGWDKEAYMRSRATQLRKKGVCLDYMPSTMENVVDYDALAALAENPRMAPCSC